MRLAVPFHFGAKNFAQFVEYELLTKVDVVRLLQQQRAPSAKRTVINSLDGLERT